MYRNNRMEKMAEIEKVIFMNMCMVYDHAGRVLALDKVGKSYSGTTFPGGHVEPGETFTESVIREIYEETGLTISNPKLTGIYHWMTGAVRNVGFLYKTDEYQGGTYIFRRGQSVLDIGRRVPAKTACTRNGTGVADDAR